MTIFEEVKNSVTARQAALQYGIKVGRNGMARCPFHNDQHPSMKINIGLCCFACGEKGDVIAFVSKVFGITPYEATIKLAEDLGVNESGYRLIVNVGKDGCQEVPHIHMHLLAGGNLGGFGFPCNNKK